MRKISINRINTTDRNHIYYLIDHGVEEKELYSGLAHVTEHACLADEGRPHREHFTWGYTCLSHMILYYETRYDLSWLNKIKKQMREGTIISPKNVERAKSEVITESRILSSQTRLGEEIVRFVTEDRISDFAMGNPAEIEKIKFQDVINYWDYLKCNHHIYEIQFRNRQDVESVFDQIVKSTWLTENATVHNFARNKASDEYLILTQNDICELNIYVQIPPMRGKGAYIDKAFCEYYLQNLFAKHLHTNISFEEKFFNKSEKYLLMTVSGIPKKMIKSTISRMRTCMEEKLSKAEMQLLYTEFTETIIQAMDQETTLDVINKHQKYLLFNTPVFSKHDLAIIKNSKSNVTAGMQYILNVGIKVVVTAME